MVAKTLVDENVEAGRRLIEELDKELSIPGALWLYMPEVDRWRLMLAVEEAEVSGPRAVYARINRVISRLAGEDVPDLEDVTVVSPRDKLIQVIGPVLKTGPGLGEMRLTGNSFSNTYIGEL